MRIFTQRGSTWFLLILSLVYFLLLILKLEQAITQDLGRHVKLGEIITSCRCVPSINLFSYTNPQFPFINHHWLSEVIFYALFSIGSIPLIIFIKICALSITLAMMILLALKKTSLKYVALALIPSIYIFSERFDSRPEIFSFLLFGIFLLLIQESYIHKKFEKRLLLLIPLQVLWVNLHIYFIIGPLVFFFFLLDMLVHNKKLPPLPFVLTYLGIIAATCVNPSGITGAFLPFTIFRNYGYEIAENQNIFFLNSVIINMRIVIFEAVILIVVIGYGLSRKTYRLYDILLVLFLTLMAIFQIRNFSLFVIGTFMYFCYSLEVITSVIKRVVDTQMRKTLMIATIAILTVVVVIHAVHLLRSPLFGFGYISYPQRALDFFIKHNLKGPIFNNFDIGSYVIFRLYPKERVYVDGRPEAYPSSFFTHYKKIHLDKALFDEEVKRQHINAIIFAHSDSTPWGIDFIHRIARDTAWKTVYVDEMMIILIKDTKENQEIIKKEKLQVIPIQ